MSDIFQNAGCIVRTVGERTTEAAADILKNAFKNNLRLISEQPFENALRNSFQCGLDMARPWTLVIDADVLCSLERLERMFEIAQTLPDNFFMFHASVTDKFFGRYRRAGNRLYNTRYLAEALNSIPEKGASLRPECDTCSTMLKKGFRNFKTFQIIGLHDYEQSYRDILRKAALFAFKHKEFHEYFEKFWGSGNDQDHQAALETLRAVAKLDQPVTISCGILDIIPTGILHKWLANEKKPLPASEFTADKADKLAVSELVAQNITPTAKLVPVEYFLCAG